MTSQRPVIISCDGHATGRPADYVPYIDPAYRERYVEFAREITAQRAARRKAMQEGTSLFTDDGSFGLDQETGDDRDGEWNSTVRTRVLEGEGIVGEVLVAGVGGDNEGRLRYGREALRVQLAAGEPGLFALVPIAFGLVAKGSMAECVAELAQLPPQVPHTEKTDTLVVTHVLAGLYEQRAVAYCAMGRSAESLHDISLARELRRVGTSEGQLLHGFAVTDLMILRDEGSAAIEQARRCRTLADEFGVPSHIRASWGLMTSSALLAGDRTAARMALEQLANFERSSPSYWRGPSRNEPLLSRTLLRMA